jgi:hypothetical protein
MKYFATTQPTADWLLTRHDALDQLFDTFTQATAIQYLCAGELQPGRIRLAACPSGLVLAMWHADYASGTGAEAWGFVQIDGSLGFQSKPDIGREVFERELYILSQRLQRLQITGQCIHRSHPNGAHTCISGRGTKARSLNVGWYESDVNLPGCSVRAVVVIGPAYDLEELSHEARERVPQMAGLVQEATSLIARDRQRPAISPDKLQQLHEAIAAHFQASSATAPTNVTVATSPAPATSHDSGLAYTLTYSDWMSPSSTLTPDQRALVLADGLSAHPLRIIGPAGSGKTLLMQLLALRQLEMAKSRSDCCRILYLVHNEKMADMVRDRFCALSRDQDLETPEQCIDVLTLSAYGRREMQLPLEQLIDTDAQDAKEYQHDIISQVLNDVLSNLSHIPAEAVVFQQISKSAELRSIFVRLVQGEISTAIKGHGLTHDERRYIESDRPLSRLHRCLSQEDRRLVFKVFKEYHRVVFQDYRVLDTDDVAISLLGRLRTPIWELKRSEIGYDFVFVDETQLFNENERRVLPLLTNTRLNHVPIALALDEAQDINGQTISGIAALGIENAANTSLFTVHRSTRAITRLAFHVIQRTSDLFGTEFPDFTGLSESVLEDSHRLACPPSITSPNAESPSFGRYVVRLIRQMRKENLWRIGVICFTDFLHDELLEELKTQQLPLVVLDTRGTRLPADKPLVALTRPAFVGGQEFEAVLLIGLEEGMVPPKVAGNEAFAVALEQQALREIYLGITRAQYRLVVVLNRNALPTQVLADAVNVGLITKNH